MPKSLSLGVDSCIRSRNKDHKPESQTHGVVGENMDLVFVNTNLA